MIAEIKAWISEWMPRVAQRGRRELPLVCTALAALTWSATPAAAQQFPPASPTKAAAGGPTDDQPTGTPLSEQIPAEQIDARVAALEAAASPNEAQTRELEHLKQVKALLAQEAEAARQVENFQRDGSDIEAKAQALQAELDRVAPDPAEGIDAQMSADQLDGLLQGARAALAAEQQALKALQEEFTSRTSRREKIPEERRAAEGRLERAQSALLEAPTGTGPEELQNAQRWQQLAERRLAEAQIRLLQAELESYDARRPLREPRQAVYQRRVSLAEARVSALTDALNRRRDADAQALQEQAVAAQRAASAAHPAVQAIRDQNTALAAELAEVLQRTRAEQERGARAAALSDALASQQTDVLKRVRDVGSYTEAIGMQLRQWLNDLPDQAAEQRAVRELEREMNRVLLRQKEVAEQRLQLADIRHEAEAALAAADDALPLEMHDDVMQAIESALREQEAGFLGPLDRAYDIYFNDALIDAVSEQKELIERAAQFRGYIEENVFWIQSTQALRLVDFAEFEAAFEWITDATHWRRAGQTALRGAQEHWLLQALGLIAIGMLVVLRQRMWRTIGELNDTMRRGTMLSYGAPLASVALVALLALPGALALWLLASALRSAEDPTPFATKLAAGFSRIAGFLFLLRFWHHLCRPSGVAQAQFGWREQSLRMMRRHGRWFAPVVLPLAFLHTITNQLPFDPHQDTLGRVAFMGSMVASSIFAWRVLNTRTGALREFVLRFRGGWIDKLRLAWFPALLVVPLVFAALAGRGYFYTAIQLEIRTLHSVIFLLCVVVANGVILRWLEVAQRRVAIDQAKKRIKQLAESQQGEAATEADKVIQAAEEIDVEALTRQSRRLAKNIIGFGIMLGLVLVWSDVLPALRVLEHFQFTWTKAVVTLSTDGTLERGEARVTLLDMLYCVVIVVLTFVFARNLPAALEITLLQRLPLSQGGRYATSTIVRYLIYIIGIVWAFETIGMGWSKVQWLAAAITVGLGFGLQEIVANFVSGLILLFEQPIRVGDTVTVGDKTGTVSRIRMRATTIVDWDRKELIIPNKEFVTGQIVNWTLTDTILRVAVPISAAYGTDTALVKRLLMEAARSSEHVLEDPPPIVVFQQFGESSLNFELRFFVPNVSYMIEVKTQVMERIHTSFKEAGVEIPFPQRAVRVISDAPAIRIEQPRAEEIGSRGGRVSDERKNPAS